MSVRFLNAGDTAFVVEFGDRIDRETNARVMGLHEAVARARGDGRLDGVVETVPTFRSLMVQYDPLATSRAVLEAEIAGLLAEAGSSHRAGRRWRLPVCYDGEDFAPDLPEIAQRTGRTTEEVVALHAGALYFAYVLGFMPGFAYMGGLPAALEVPRRTEPRVRVPATSVAIAGTMTAIYPWESPGGWHLIGRTPVPLFDLRRPSPILLAAGDEIAFRRVDRAEHDALAAAAAAGTLDLAALRAEAAS